MDHFNLTSLQTWSTAFPTSATIKVLTLLSAEYIFASRMPSKAVIFHLK